MATGTIKSAPLYMLIDATGTTGSISAYSAKSVALTSDGVPNGYHFFSFLPLRTNGFVGFGYMTSITNAWVGNPTGSAVSGTIICSYLVERD